MNVCIIPTGDRSGQANLIHHYSKIGFKVYLPLHGTGGLDWKGIATWPALLTRSTKNQARRNIEIHGFNRKDNFVVLGRTLAGNFFGEDRFLLSEDNGPLYGNNDVTCELVDFERERIHVDLFHTLRGSDRTFKRSISFQERYFPKAKWITSTIFSNHHLPGKRKPANVCKMLPANYDELYRELNCFDCYPSGFEFELLNVRSNSGEPRKGFASFNHNFKARYPEDYKLLAETNKLLKQHDIFIPNYGGNISGQGADTKYHSGGPTGSLPTLSIREAANLNTRLKGIVVFKQADYGGGVIWYALMAGTPIVTHQKYLDVTHAGRILTNGYNTAVVNTPEQAAEMIVRLNEDAAFAKKLASGMQQTFRDIITDEYWKKFRVFAERALAN